MLMHHANTLTDCVIGTTEMHRCPMSANFTTRWTLQPVEDIHQRGFTRAVFTQQDVNLPALDTKIYAIVG